MKKLFTFLEVRFGFFLPFLFWCVYFYLKTNNTYYGYRSHIIRTISLSSFLWAAVAPIPTSSVLLCLRKRRSLSKAKAKMATTATAAATPSRSRRRHSETRTHAQKLSFVQTYPRTHIHIRGPLVCVCVIFTLNPLIASNAKNIKIVINK